MLSVSRQPHKISSQTVCLFFLICKDIISWVSQWQQTALWQPDFAGKYRKPEWTCHKKSVAFTYFFSPVVIRRDLDQHAMPQMQTILPFSPFMNVGIAVYYISRTVQNIKPFPHLPESFRIEEKSIHILRQFIRFFHNVIKRPVNPVALIYPLFQHIPVQSPCIVGESRMTLKNNIIPKRHHPEQKYQKFFYHTASLPCISSCACTRR